MASERWQRIKELFHAAAALEADQRAAFLDEACAGDPSLREQVEALLAADERADGFIEASALEVAASEMAGDANGTLTGRHVGPYRILREIGRGGMGVVYLAERSDGVYRKQVALKLVPRGAESTSVLNRFRTERQILAVLDHPNIAKLLDGGSTEDSLPYFVMDYVQGLPIDAYCDTHRLSVVERLRLFRRVCSAVHYAHEHEVVHRDLKPSNILVTDQGEPKLLDFGIAKLLDPKFVLTTGVTTVTGLRPMTPEYASPEQVRGSAISTASDIYSLGVLLYELLTGHRPYQVKGHTPQEVERLICEQDPEKPSRIVDRVEQLPSTDGKTPITLTPELVSASRSDQPEKLRRRLAGDLDNIVLVALRKEPERRYASVEQFSEDIRRYLEGLPVIARKDTLWYRSAKFIKRRKARVVAVALVMLVVIGFYLLTRSEKAADTAIDSIAVLPFVNVGGDPDMEYLSDGITESLINSLSQLPKQRVVPRSSVFRYKGREVDPQKVGRDLGVRAVLAGRVLQQGDRLSIQAELIDVKNVSQLWGEHYNRKLSDTLAVEEEVAKEISAKLRLRLTGEDKRWLTKRYTENAEAYQLYLRGRYFWNKRTNKGFMKALDYFNQAIGKDPKYALAYVGLADCYTMLADYDWLPAKEVAQKAKTAITKALEIDDSIAEAHTSLADIRRFYDWDWPGAEREYRRSLELNPNYVTAHQWYAEFLAAMGRHEEAIREMKRAEELDPLSLVVKSAAGWVLFFARNYDQAIEQCQRVIEMDPSYGEVYSQLRRAYEQKGMYREALAADEKLRAFKKKREPRSFESLDVSALQSAKAYWRKILQLTKEDLESVENKEAARFRMVESFAQLGERDQAFEWLEKAYEEHSFWLPFLKVHPHLDPLRSDPRFSDLMRRVRLVP